VAQLALMLAGGVLGGAVAGGLGQSLGALFGAYLGGILDRELVGPQEDRRLVEGARIAEFNLSGSAYGQTIPAACACRPMSSGCAASARVVRTETETVGSGGGGGKGGGLGGGGSGGAQTVTRTTYHYYADVALAVCEGPVTSVYRVWFDRTPLDPEHVGEVRTYYGDKTQAPDPLIQAVEGAGRTPGFRGLTYLVLENLYLTPYGNHFPNFEVEVFRGSPAETDDARHLVRSVCLIPASGEWAYEPTIVHSRVRNEVLNTHTGRKASDFSVAIENLGREVPNVEWISLVYAWFGTSTDVATCSIRPECEYAIHPDRLPDTAPYLWSVMGVGRPDGSTGLYYGGTIGDGSVIRAIQHLRGLGYKVLFYPFLMMDIPPPDPQPFPWRGRIGGAAADVASFFEREDGYLRFVRHCMSLCEQAGGIDGFAVGSEMAGLNRIRDGGGDYPAVAYWRQIAAEAKARLGSSCVVTYAADWSEYRYHDRGNANVDFPLDALWADPNIDVVGSTAAVSTHSARRSTIGSGPSRTSAIGGRRRMCPGSPASRPGRPVRRANRSGSPNTAFRARTARPTSRTSSSTQSRSRATHPGTRIARSTAPSSAPRSKRPRPSGMIRPTIPSRPSMASRWWGGASCGAGTHGRTRSSRA
jgi:GTA TIM-barrel-like domain